MLVAEDYPPLAKVVAIAIHREGHRVERAGSLTRALALPDRFDLAVIDIDLPDGRGTDLAEQLLSEDRVDAVIFFTSSRDQERRAVAESLGRVVLKEAGVDALMVALRDEMAHLDRFAEAVGADTPGAIPIAKRSGTLKRYDD